MYIPNAEDKPVKELGGSAAKMKSEGLPMCPRFSKCQSEKKK